MFNDPLTSEKLRNHFANNFELVNFSIRVARDKIKGGEPAPLADVLELVDELSLEKAAADKSKK